MLGEEIRRAREEAGLSQEELADKAQLHRTYISLLERNKKSPTVAVLARIAVALGLQASELIQRSERKGHRSH
jgi:transcriptional regulator with XRE-family HTH domain